MTKNNLVWIVECHCGLFIECPSQLSADTVLEVHHARTGHYPTASPKGRKA